MHPDKSKKIVRGNKPQLEDLKRQVPRTVWNISNTWGPTMRVIVTVATPRTDPVHIAEKFWSHHPLPTTRGSVREDKRATIFNVGSANTRRSVNQHSVSMSPGSTVGPRTSYARSKWAEVRGSVFVVKVSSVSATWTSTSVPNTSPIPSSVMFVGRPQGTSTLSTTTRGFATTLPSRNTTTLSRGLGRSVCESRMKPSLNIRASKLSHHLVQASEKEN